MRFFIGVTDQNWFRFLAYRKPDEINFWRPSSKATFRAIPQGAPFLFKLHSPNNYIVGGGFFVRHFIMPISLVWDTFRENNGAETYASFYNSLMAYNRSKEVNPSIGCTILTEPFFFEKPEWIPVPPSWKPNIVRGKTYSTSDEEGRRLWDAVLERLGDLSMRQGEIEISDYDKERDGKPVLIKSRIGQGAFRMMVTEAYNRKCAITGEKTLPVLEASHIRSYSENGPNLTSNGLLLRSDMHKLFDRGYITLDDHYRVEVSRRIREEYENGREYYAWHGKTLSQLPERREDAPDRKFLTWHQNNVYKY